MLATDPSLKPMHFCSDCGQPVSLVVPEDDNRLRHVCGECGTVHYQNPKLVVGTIPCWQAERQVLLCKRAIEPRRGYWTLPAGFMENNETTEEAAQRETMEEAGARVELLGLFALLNVPHVHQVHLFYRARLLDLDFSAGTESLECRMFSESDIPWQDLAFPTVSHTLKRFFADLGDLMEGKPMTLHTHDIRKRLQHPTTTS